MYFSYTSKCIKSIIFAYFYRYRLMIDLYYKSIRYGFLEQKTHKVYDKPTNKNDEWQEILFYIWIIYKKLIQFYYFWLVYFKYNQSDTSVETRKKIQDFNPLYKQQNLIENIIQ